MTLTYGMRQWRDHPYALNGKPMEVETEITVNLVLFESLISALARA